MPINAENNASGAGKSSPAPQIYAQFIGLTEPCLTESTNFATETRLDAGVLTTPTPLPWNRLHSAGRKGDVSSAAETLRLGRAGGHGTDP
jgi:hypothetical protein